MKMVFSHSSGISSRSATRGRPVEMVSEPDDRLHTSSQAIAMEHLKAAGVNPFHARCLFEYENRMFQRISEIEKGEGVEYSSPRAAMVRMSSNIEKAVRQYMNSSRKMASAYESGGKETAAMSVMERSMEILEAMHQEHGHVNQDRSPNESSTSNQEEEDIEAHPIKDAASSVLKDTCTGFGKMTMRLGGGRVVGEVLASAAASRQLEASKTASAIAFDRQQNHQEWMRKSGMIQKDTAEVLKRPEIDATGMKFMELLMRLGEVYHIHGSRCMSVEPSFENTTPDFDGEMDLAIEKDRTRQTPLIWIGGQRVRVKLPRTELNRIVSEFSERRRTQGEKTVDMSDMVNPRAVIAPVQVATPRSPRTVYRENLREARARALEAIWNDDLPPSQRIDGEFTSILGNTTSTSLLRSRDRSANGSRSRPASSAGLHGQRGRTMAWHSEQSEKGRIWTMTGASVSAFSKWTSAELFVLRRHARATPPTRLNTASAKISGLAATSSVRKDML